MPITNEGKAAILRGDIEFGAEEIKLALFTAAAAFDVDTLESYSSTHEVTGAGYTAGGVTLQNVTVLIDQASDQAYLRADPVQWNEATLSGIRYLVLYAPGSTNRAIAFYDLGSDEAVTAQTLILTPGTNAATSMLVLG